ncbi:basic proline-rich protein-like [Schistocerca piceifrons]|uniref:basic proline-rich protein-like n=1 Tax=Schistocerca piceifrons TaxID=274613 RepID=UPI001F5E3B84|nr:basic proline-rich protein-like [Schistocerca piceifrons]
MAQQYRYQPVVAPPPPPGQQFGYGYAPQYYPSPPASSLQYPHYHQELCYPAPPYFHHKSSAYSTPPPPPVAVPPPVAAAAAAAAAAQRYHRGYLSAPAPAPAPAYDQPASGSSSGASASASGSAAAGQVVPLGSSSSASGGSGAPSGGGSYAPVHDTYAGSTGSSASGPAPPPPAAVVDAYPPPPPPPAAYYGYAQPPGGPPPPPPVCYTHSPTRSLPYIEYPSCPCPMQSCPKNVHTGPLTGDSSKGPAKPQLQLQLQPPAAQPQPPQQAQQQQPPQAPAPAPAPPPPMPLPLEPAPCPPSPARGSAGVGVPPPPSPSRDGAAATLLVRRPRQEGSPAALPHTGAAGEATITSGTVTAPETKTEVKCEPVVAATVTPSAVRKRRPSAAHTEAPTAAPAPKKARTNSCTAAEAAEKSPPPAAEGPAATEAAAPAPAEAVRADPVPTVMPPKAGKRKGTDEVPTEQQQQEQQQQQQEQQQEEQQQQQRKLAKVNRSQAKVYPHRKKLQPGVCINNNRLPPVEAPAKQLQANGSGPSPTPAANPTPAAAPTAGRKVRRTAPPPPRTAPSASVVNAAAERRRRRSSNGRRSPPPATPTGQAGTAPSVPARRQSRVLSGPRKSLGPRWSNGWSWEGASFEAKVFLTSDDVPVTRKCYPAMRHVEGDLVCPHDCILLKSGPRKLDLPFVAKVAALWENPDDGEMMMSLLWYYRPEHTEQGISSADTEDEIFASKHKDINSVACIEDKCYVLTFTEYCRYRKVARRQDEGVREPPLVVPPPEDNPRSRFQPPPSVSSELVFYCRRVYDFRQKRILSSRVSGGSRYARQLNRNRSRLM